MLIMALFDTVGFLNKIFHDIQVPTPAQGQDISEQSTNYETRYLNTITLQPTQLHLFILTLKSRY